MSHPTTAVVVSGHTMALAVVRALGEAGVPVVVVHYDDRDIAHTSRYVSAEFRTKNPEREEGAFLSRLMELGEPFRGSVLMPASDESLVAISSHKQELGKYYRVACPDWTVTRDLIDKSRTYALAEAHGIPSPITFVPESEADLIEKADQIGLPALVKPATSHLFYSKFKLKMVRVSTLDELLAAYRSSTKAGLEIMLQEIIPGDDSQVVNHNCYVFEGECLVEFTARHIRNAPPFFGSPRVVRSERIPEVVGPGRQIVRALGLTGFACTEFKFDARDGLYKLMEVNGRHNLSGLLAVRCGINFPLLDYKLLAEDEVPSATDFKTGLYWIDGFRDVGYSLGYLAKEHYRPRQYLAPYFSRHCGAISDRRDMGPFWARSRYLLRHFHRTAQNAGVSRPALRPGKETE